MALNPARTSLSTACKTLRQCRPTMQQPLIRRLPGASPVSVRRQFSSSTPRRQDDNLDESAVEGQGSERPRWTYTPERLKGPFRINQPKKESRTVWSVNEKPELLDAMYKRLLGHNGDKMLPDEIKWLAVTHKSFDYGRRGFNTRLAYYGRQILALEATRSILVSAQSATTPTADPFGREPFQHPALANVDKLSRRQPQDMMEKLKVARFARGLGLHDVIRWKPKMPENLAGSGLTVVLNTCVYAIIGAISLQHGAEVAQRVARERVLRRLA